MLTPGTIHLVRLNEAEWKKHIGKMYIVTPDDKLYESVESDNAIESFNTAGVYPYEVIQVKSPSDFEDQELAAAVKENGATLVSAVLDCEQGGALFLMEHAEDNTLIDEAVLFAFKVDKSNRDAIVTMVFNYAINAPQECSSWIENVRLAASAFIFRSRRQPRDLDEELHSFKERFIDNVQIARDKSEPDTKRAQAINEIKTVCSSLSQAALAEFMLMVITTGVIPDDETIKSLFLNLDEAAEKSDIHLYIRKNEEENTKSNKRMAKYNITFKKGENSEEKVLKFPGHAETAIYIALLIDRCKEQRESIYLKDIKNLFIGVYRCLYKVDYDDASSTYDKIFDTTTREFSDLEQRYVDVWRQGRSRTYIPNIRRTVNEAFSGLDNPAIYHYVQGGRLHVNKDHIKIPQKFIDKVDSLQNP